MFGVALGPIVGRLIDHLVPWHASIISVVLLGAIQVIQVGAGGSNISAVIIVAFALDVFRPMLQVSLTTSVFTCGTIFPTVLAILIGFRSQDRSRGARAPERHYRALGMCHVLPVRNPPLMRLSGIHRAGNGHCGRNGSVRQVWLAC